MSYTDWINLQAESYAQMEVGTQHNITKRNVMSKKKRKADILFKWHAHDDNFLWVTNIVADQLGEILWVDF